jgi:hypothetical protein
MSEATLDPNDSDDVFLARTTRLGPQQLSFATFTTFLWIYLVVGEFVLSGLPEALGWTIVIATTGANYWALERELAGYLRNNLQWRRAMTLLQVVLMFLVVLLLAIILGIVLPERAVTILLFVSIAVMALWNGRVRARHFPVLPRPNRGRRVAWVAMISVLTLAAVAALLARQ